MIADNPFFGLGFGAARWISDQGRHMVIEALPHSQLDVMPLHTHNGWLQIWLETGLVGILAVLSLVAQVAVRARRRYAERAPLMAIAAAAASTMTVASLSFGIWQDWWLATMALNVVLVLILFRADGSPSPTQAPPGSN
jgi:O-antigen ligase